MMQTGAAHDLAMAFVPALVGYFHIVIQKKPISESCQAPQQSVGIPGNPKPFRTFNDSNVLVDSAEICLHVCILAAIISNKYRSPSKVGIFANRIN